ncbi:putative permease [Burkholderiales bacterium JOSHI_001]|nr:putative permease [Burkholderiales bacterium JOSHI_001]
MAALALLFNAFTWGVSWWPFRQLQGLGVHPLWATALCYAVAWLLLLARRPRALREVLAHPALWVLVLASGSTNAAFNWAMTIGDVVRVVLLFYLMPLWAVGLAWALLGEKPGGGALARVALALAGALTVLWPEGGGLPLPRTLADGLAIVGGFFFALNNVMLRREAARSDGARALAMFTGGVLVSAMLALWLQGRGAVGALPPPAWGWCAGLALLALWFLGSNLALQYGATRLPAAATAVIMVSEVFFASGSAIALGAGQFSLQVALGGALILAAAALAAWPARPAPA